MKRIFYGVAAAVLALSAGALTSCSSDDDVINNGGTSDATGGSSSDEGTDGTADVEEAVSIVGMWEIVEKVYDGNADDDADDESEGEQMFFRFLSDNTVYFFDYDADVDLDVEMCTYTFEEGVLTVFDEDGYLMIKSDNVDLTEDALAVSGVDYDGNALSMKMSRVDDPASLTIFKDILSVEDSLNNLIGVWKYVPTGDDDGNIGSLEGWYVKYNSNGYGFSFDLTEDGGLDVDFIRWTQVSDLIRVYDMESTEDVTCSTVVSLSSSTLVVNLEGSSDKQLTFTKVGASPLAKYLE